MPALPTPVRITADTPEPPPGSVIMRDGLTGTVFQRFFSTGRYHAPTGQVVDFTHFTARVSPRLAGDFIILFGEDA